MPRLLMHRSGRTFLVKDLGSDYHCQFGLVKKHMLKKKTGKIKTNTGESLSIIDSGFIDEYKKIRRGPQIIPLKDIGSIITITGIGRKSVCLDAGAGSGALSLFLAHIVKKVISYEIREDFFKVVKRNIEHMGLKNILLKNQDIYEGIKEKNIDLITLDLPEPWKVIPHAETALKNGGFLVSYSPTIPQVADFVNSLSERFINIKTIEIIEREWEVAGRKVRPKSQQIGHSGFLTFCRRI